MGFDKARKERAFSLPILRIPALKLTLMMVFLLHLVRKQDRHLLDTFHQILVDMRKDRFLERPAQIGIFLCAAFGAREFQELDLRKEWPERF